jgi:hypothetical protein
MKDFRDYYDDITKTSITPEYFIENFEAIEDACLRMHEGFNNYMRVNKGLKLVERFNPLSVINLELNPWATEENLDESVKLFLVLKGYEYNNIERKNAKK